MKRFVILFCFFSCFVLADDNASTDLLVKLTTISDLKEQIPSICYGYYEGSLLLKYPKYEFYEYYAQLNKEENIEEKNKEKDLFNSWGYCLFHYNKPEIGILALEIAVFLGESEAAVVLSDYYTSDGFTLPKSSNRTWGPKQ